MVLLKAMRSRVQAIMLEGVIQFAQVHLTMRTQNKPLTLLIVFTNIHTRTPTAFHNFTIGSVLQGFLMTNACEQLTWKEKKKCSPLWKLTWVVQMFKDVIVFFVCACSFFLLLLLIRYNDCDTWLMLHSTLRLWPLNQSDQKPLNTINQLPSFMLAWLTK